MSSDSDNRDKAALATDGKITVVSTRATVIDVAAIALGGMLVAGVVVNAIRQVAIPTELTQLATAVVAFYFGGRTRRDFGG